MKNTPGEGGQSPRKGKREAGTQRRGEGGEPWRKVGTPRAVRGAAERRTNTRPRSEAEGPGRRAADGGGHGEAKGRSREGDA